MKKALAIAFTVGVIVCSGLAHADADTCLTVVDRNIGKNCGSRSSHEVRMRNSCHRTIVSKLCLERRDGRPGCGMNSTMKPGDTVYTSVCEGTGKYAFDACDKDDYDRGRCTIVRDGDIRWDRR